MHPFNVSAGFCLRNTSGDNVQDNILRDGVKTSTHLSGWGKNRENFWFVSQWQRQSNLLISLQWDNSDDKIFT